MNTRTEQWLKLSGDVFFLLGPDGSVYQRAGPESTPADETIVRPENSLFELIHPSDRPLLIRRLELLQRRHQQAAAIPATTQSKPAAKTEHDEDLDAHEPASLECRMLNPGGEYRWMKLKVGIDAAQSEAEAQKPLRFLVVAKDIHAQKEREALSNLFFDEASVGLNLCTMDGTWIESNPAFLAMLGYSKEQADGKLSYWQLTPSKYAEQEQRQLEQLKLQGKYGPYEKEFIRADGSLVPVRLNGFIVHKEGTPFIWSIIEDTSQQERLKAEIAKKTTLFEAIAENIPTALFVKDARDDFRITLWNRAAEDVFHRPRRSILGKSSHEVWPKEQADRYTRDDYEVVQKGQLVDIAEEPSTLPDGSTILLHTKKFPLKLGSDDGFKLLLCISEDITARKKLEADLRAAIEVRDEFLSIASHELKTPFTALSLQLQLIQKLLSSDAPAQKEKAGYLSLKATESCRQLNELLNELLDITKIRAGKLSLDKRRMDLSAATETLLGQLSEEIRASGSVVHLSIEGPMWGVWDPNRIHQVLSNLLSNALKFGEKGPIDISIRRKKGGEEKVILTVRDRGLGIAPQMHDAIFKRFERGVSAEKFSGLGLGLYIVRQVLDAHGGSIRVESTPGRGALFVVELPLEPKERAIRAD